ncbi:MAG: hypothetical protein KAY24_19545 [Candidatus Eisenbacteria sp.]|nr:hypothetical protein [Candidatus Eisenbacteria bacterium]
MKSKAEIKRTQIARRNTLRSMGIGELEQEQDVQTYDETCDEIRNGDWGKVIWEDAVVAFNYDLGQEAYVINFKIERPDGTGVYLRVVNGGEVESLDEGGGWIPAPKATV